MRLSDLLIPTYKQMLQTLSGLLDKAKTQVSAAEAETLLSARLAPDMYPLASQLRFAAYQVQEATFRLLGDDLPEWLDQVASEGRNANDRPGSISDAKVRIDEALLHLNGLNPHLIDGGGADRQVTIELPNGVIFDMTGEQYARDWALAQFYFHVITAYAILRNYGIDIGKADYVPHMFAYLRPGSTPQS